MLEKIKKTRLPLKLFSVVLAVIAWLFITYTVDPTISYHIRNVPVSFTGEAQLEERGLVLTNKDEIDSVNVKVRGARSAVINAINTISARADISDITTEGANTRKINIDLGVAGVVTTDRYSPSAQLQIERLVDKEVPVKIVNTGTEKNRQVIVATQSAQDKITIRGARSELEKVRYALISADISNIEQQTTRELPYTLVDAGETKVNCTTLINPPGEISVSFNIYPRISLPIKIRLPESETDEWALDVRSQSRDKLDVGLIDSELKLDELTAYFTPSSYHNTQDEYTIYLKVPDGVYIPVGSETLTARLALEHKAVKEITLPIETRSVESGLSAHLSSTTVNLKLRGAQSVLNKESITAYVNAAGLGAGHYELEVQIESNADVTLEETAHIGVDIK